jgi:hypothetical protein
MEIEPSGFLPCSQILSFVQELFFSFDAPYFLFYNLFVVVHVVE